MLDELSHYYGAAGISALGFRCPMSARCSAVCADFITAREAFVGSEYELGTLPRLLFVSLDPSFDLAEGDPARRTLAAMRQWEESKVRSPGGGVGFPKMGHWYQTQKFAHELLLPVARARRRTLPFQEVHRYFAHTNSAKCKDAARGTCQGHRELFKNCRRFIPGEVEVLSPDVLVTQGAPARASLKGAFEVLSRAEAPNGGAYSYEVILVGGRQVLKYTMSHPCAWQGGRYPREVRDAWGWYMSVGHSFLLEGAGALAAMGTRED